MMNCDGDVDKLECLEMSTSNKIELEDAVEQNLVADEEISKIRKEFEEVSK